MSPLLIVGITFLTAALGDVSHVLQRKASNPREINDAFETKNPQDFWWMRSDSPLKASYDFFKRCASSGNCLGSGDDNSIKGGGSSFGPIDVRSNVFLNGKVAQGSGSSSVAFSSSSATSSGCSGGCSGKATPFHSGANLDLSNNPFLKGQYVSAGQGIGSISGNCVGNGRICVPKQDCVNGVIKGGQNYALKASNNCDNEKEVCCQLPGQRSSSGVSLAHNINELLFTAGKSSVPGSTIKFNSGVGLSPGQIQIISTSGEPIRPHLNFIGQSGSPSSTVKPARDVAGAASNAFFSSTPDYSNVQFDSNVRFASTIQGPGYLPPDYLPPPTKKPSCGPGQYLTADGRCENIQQPCPPGTRQTPSGQCEKIPPTCPAGKKPGPFGDCVDIPPPPCPPGTFRTSSGTCQAPTTTPTPPTTSVRCGPGEKLGPYGRCIRIEITTTPAPYCPSGTRRGPSGVCVPIQPPTPACPPGKQQSPFGGCIDVPRPPPPVTPPETPYCPSGTRRGHSGTCIPVEPPRPTLGCPPGKKQGASGSCIDIPKPPPLIITTPAPYCPSGTRRGPSGTCIPVEPPRPTPGCPFGKQPGPFGNCVDIPRPPPPPPITTQAPYCPSGTRRGPSGTCTPVEPPQPPSTCPPGKQLGAFGACVDIPRPPPPVTTQEHYCPSGTRRGPSGVCIPIEPPRPPPGCPPGKQPGAIGSCVDIPRPPPPPPITTQAPYCPSGTHKGSSGQCEPNPPRCGPGQKQDLFGRCVPIVTPPPPAPPKKCPPGQQPGPYGGCVIIESPPQCPPGTYRGASGNCERPKPPPPPTTTSREYLPPKIETTTNGGYRYPTPRTPFEPPHSGSNTDEVTTDRDTENTDNRNVIVQAPGNCTDRNRRPVNCPITSGSDVSDTNLPPDVIPHGCAAALKCVQEIYCTADGIVSPVPVVLTKQQELLKAPTTVCRDIESGIIGKCCRDPNYVDPWPSANLVDGVDDGQYKEDDSLGQYKVDTNRIARSSRRGLRVSRVSRSKRAISNQVCGERNHNTSPPGPGPLDVNFAEIPWQAMILRDSNRSLLCGGVIIRPNAVLTAAHCVKGLETSDILIKGGEWKLGIDEEPLPFQIVKVAAISRHPDYKTGSYLNDLAVLVLEESLRYTKNIGQLCLPAPNQIPTENCIATGWGKRILQLHARGAIMHSINVNIMDNQQCRNMLTQYFPSAIQGYSPNTLCGYSDIDQCKVDYGSALACADESGRYVLSGIYSWDTGCKQQGQIGGYVAPDVEWIDYVLSKPLTELKREDRAYRSGVRQT